MNNIESTMNNVQAKSQIEKGKKVSHMYFEPHEWVMGLPNGEYQFEDGVTISPTDFWRTRSDEFWIEDWGLWEQPK